MKPGKVTRVIHILTTLQTGKTYTADNLSKLFNKSRRTIFRDLNELKAIGVPYHYDAKTGSYSINPEFFLPPLDLNLQEALSLLLLVHKTTGQMQLPFRNSVVQAALKIENNLPAKIRQYCNAALQNISARPQPQATTNLLDKTFEQLQKAIAEKRIARIKYHSLFEGGDIDTELCPCHLMFNSRAWYVLGFSSIHSQIRTFNLSRIKDLTVSDKCFTDSGKFDPQEYLGRAWSMIPEGRIYNVSLRFLPKVAENVTEVQWHSTQKVTRNSDGSATVEFRVDGLGEISWWILGYGDQVQVLTPKILRNKIVETAKNILSLNQNL
jgi:proteasome accessory factor B